jgi:hypothetical protein
MSKPGSKTEFALFNVFYEDGSQRSNRRVPRDLLEGLDAEINARAALEAQDEEIAEKSGRPRLPIKQIVKVG